METVLKKLQMAVTLSLICHNTAIGTAEKLSVAKLGDVRFIKFRLSATYFAQLLLQATKGGIQEVEIQTFRIFVI